jgi:TolB-like protein/class 3 adenylate cyclase/Tfp pilus assembly protein PilF
VRQTTAPPGVKRKLAAILSADVKGYSRLMAADEEGTLRTLNAYRQEMDARVAGRDGRIVGSAGDSVLAEFPSAVEATRCAVEIQQELAARNSELPKDRRLEFRIGINLGDVMVEGDDLFGDGVNVAARLQSLAEPGGIYVSGAIYDQIRGKLPFGADFLGEQTVKNIAEPIRVYRLRSDRATLRRRVPRRWRTRMAIAAGCGLLVSAAAGTAWYFDLPRAFGPTKKEQAFAPSLPDRPSLAVLPFENVGDDAQQGYFADGLTDDLITELSKISGLLTIARNSVFNYKDKAPDIRQVAKELGVRYVLEGSVRRAGEQLRINAQLIDGTTGSHVWAERYDRTYADIFALQDEVIGQIVKALSVQLTKTEQSQVARLPTESLEAYDYYLRAEQLAYRADADSTADALADYDKALALDPKFADAYAGYARVATDVLAYDFANTLPAAVARKRAYEAAGRALALNPQLSLGYSVLGLLQMLDGQHDQAVASARKAVALSPNSAEAYLNLAVVLIYAGLHEDALQAAATVLRLNPKPGRQVHEYQAFVLYMNHRYADALAALGERRDEIGILGLEMLAGANARLGRMDEARAAIKTLLQRQPEMCIAWFRVTFAHHAREQDLNDRLEALRLAGLYEWPYGVEGDPAHQLKAEAIDASTFGRTWAGERVGSGPFMQYVETDGTFIERGPNMQVTGGASRRGNLLCLTFPALSMGRPLCGPIYRNPTGSPDHQDEYTYLNAYEAKRFSVAE